MRNRNSADSSRRADVLRKEVYDITQAMVKLNDLSFELQRERLHKLVEKGWPCERP